MTTDLQTGWEPDSTIDIAPEDQAKLRLTTWFESYGATVYWEKDSPYGRDTFTSRSTAEKPDLLVEHVGWPTVAYEVKIGDDGTAIYDGAIQTVRYWREYERGNGVYRADGREISPAIFSLVTGNAPFGRLYNDAKVKDRFKTDIDTSEGRKIGADLKQVPRHEYSSSETTTRLMWRISDLLSRDHSLSPESGVGSLYSDLLDKPESRSTEIESLDPGILHKLPGQNPNWLVLDDSQ
jgi:hypothetical protein